MSCRGSKLHQDFVEFLSNEAPYATARLVNDHCLLFPTGNEDSDADKAKIIGTNGVSRPGDKNKRGGAYYPDAVWEYWERGCDENDFAMAVEVGRLTPARLPSDIPVVHVGFDGVVNVLNFHADEAQVMLRIREVLQTIIYDWMLQRGHYHA